MEDQHISATEIIHLLSFHIYTRAGSVLIKTPSFPTVFTIINTSIVLLLFLKNGEVISTIISWFYIIIPPSTVLLCGKSTNLVSREPQIVPIHKGSTQISALFGQEVQILPSDSDLPLNGSIAPLRYGVMMPMNYYF